MTVLFDLARAVVDAWEKGDLAGAVHALDGHLCDIEAGRATPEEPLDYSQATQDVEDAIAEVRKRIFTGEAGFERALVSKGIQLGRASLLHEQKNGPPSQGDFLHALALRWAERREVQELKVGTAKHAARQYDFFVGALTGAEILGHPYNPMVLILLNATDALKAFAKVEAPEGGKQPK